MKEWQKETSSIRPREFDFETTPGNVIQRKNIIENTVTDEENNTRIEFSCDMRFLTTIEFAEQTKADVDYISIMTGVNCDV